MTGFGRFEPGKPVTDRRSGHQGATLPNGPPCFMLKLMNESLSRREFVTRMGVAAAALSIAPRLLAAEPWFKISLAQWSLHRALRE